MPKALVLHEIATCSGNFNPIRIQTSTCMRCPMKAHEILRLVVKTAYKSDEYWLRYQRVQTENFSMFNFMLQAIASDLNVQLQVYRE